jgi:hypothetical protein
MRRMAKGKGRVSTRSRVHHMIWTHDPISPYLALPRQDRRRARLCLYPFLLSLLSPRSHPGTKKKKKHMTTTSPSTTATAPTPLPQTYHYIRFAIAPALSPDDSSSDGLQIRRALQDALAQSFGAALSHTYLDVLWVATSGDECVVRASSQR